MAKYTTPPSLPRGSSLESPSPTSPTKASSPRRSGSFSFRFSGTPIRKTSSIRKTSTPNDETVHAAFPSISETGGDGINQQKSSYSPSQEQKIPFKLTKTKLERKISDIKTVIEMDSETDRIKSDAAYVPSKSLFDDPETYRLEDGEKRKYLAPMSNQPESSKLEDLIGLLTEWINNELGDGESRMQVTNLEEDLRDGLIVAQLVGSLSGQTIQLPFGRYVQSSQRQFNNLQFVLKRTQEVLELKTDEIKWKIKEIWVKNLLACIYLVLDIVEKFHDKIEIDIPQSFDIKIVQATRNEGGNTFQVSTDKLNLPQRKLKVDTQDPLDAILAGNSDRHKEAKSKLYDTMKQFANHHLAPFGKQCAGDLSEEFADGTKLILIIGQLEGFFVPLYNYNPLPKTRKEKLTNAEFALELLQDLEIGKEYARIGLRPETLVSGDKDAILRILFQLSKKFKR